MNTFPIPFEIHKITQSIFLLFGLMFSSLANAYYYAYVPDLTTKNLLVINTEYQVLVEAIPLFGSPRDVLINNSGTTVYITTIVEDAGIKQSYINVVDTLELDSPRFFKIFFENVRGMAISQDDNNLYVTHEVGITLIKGPYTTHEVTDLTTTYRGKSLVLSKDNKYLFVLGSDNALDPDYGVSVIDTETFLEVATYSTGAKTNSNAIAFDNLKNKLFIANQDSDEILSLSVNNYDDPTSINITALNTSKMPDDSSPIALLLKEESSSLYVALSYIDAETELATGEGYVALLDSNTFNLIETITLSDEESEYKSGGVVHPASLGMTNDGNVMLLKRIWSDKAGLYLSEIKEIYGASSNRLLFDEVNSVLIDNKASIFSNGKFIGPNCEECPTGIETIFVERTKPSALNPLLFILFAIVIIFRKRIYK